MKKVLGLAVLAAMPVACGTVPTAPETSFDAVPSAESAFTASGRGRAVPSACPTEQDWSSVVGITLDVVRVGKTSVTMRAELLLLSDMSPTPCFTPVFTVASVGRTGATLTSGRDRQEATLTGPAGKYTVTVFTETSQRTGLTARLQVELPPTGRR
ncbi:MAG: hypothetical protein ABW221_23470 [Vicinamibacteria bacterium]